ncbi:hypothetical protein C8R47DRAFT_992941, partial [Mycena vitilis]
GRKIEHLDSNIGELDISLSKEQIEFLEGVVPFDPGFPSFMIVSECITRLQTAYPHESILQGDGTKGPSAFLKSGGQLAGQPLLEAIRPTKN